MGNTKKPFYDHFTSMGMDAVDKALEQDKKGYRTNSHWNEYFKWVSPEKLYSSIDYVKREAANRNISQGQRRAFDQVAKQAVSHYASTYDPDKVDTNERSFFDKYQESMKKQNTPKKDSSNLPYMANKNTKPKAVTQSTMGGSENDRLNDATAQKNAYGQDGNTPSNKTRGKSTDSSVIGRHDLDARFGKDPCASIDKYDIIGKQACRNKNPVTGPDAGTVVNTVAGYGDAVSLGATKLIREKAGIDGGVDEDSTAYAVGEAASVFVPGAGVGARTAAEVARKSKAANKILNKGKFRIGYQKQLDPPKDSPFAPLQERPRVAWGHPKKGPDGKIDKKAEAKRHKDLRFRPLDSVKQQMGQILKEQKGKKPSDVFGQLNNYRKQLVKRGDETGSKLIKDWTNQYLYQNKNKEWFWKDKPYWE